MRKPLWILAILTALLSVFALIGTASADASVTTSQVSAVSGTSTAAGCAVQLNNGPVGYRICGTDATYMQFNDGTERMFVIGTDHAVWNIVEYPNGTQSGWRSLGGWLQNGVYSYIYDPRYAYDLEIWSYGQDAPNGAARCTRAGLLAPLLIQTIKAHRGPHSAPGALATTTAASELVPPTRG